MEMFFFFFWVFYVQFQWKFWVLLSSVERVGRETFRILMGTQLVIAFILVCFEINISLGMGLSIFFFFFLIFMNWNIFSCVVLGLNFSLNSHVSTFVANLLFCMTFEIPRSNSWLQICPTYLNEKKWRKGFDFNVLF